MAETSSLFLPDSSNAQAIDAKVRNRLCGSFSWLAETFDGLDFQAEDLASWHARPVDFGFYFDLASAKYHGTEADGSGVVEDTIERLTHSVRTNNSDAGAVSIVNLSSTRYDDRELDCLKRWFDIEPENEMALLPLTDAEFEEASDKLGKALALLERAAPELSGELSALTSEFIFAKPGPAAKFKFGGASAFTLWGAIALNGVTHPNWWDYLVRIVHEYSHSLLFGIAADQQLVLNDPEERYISPLRGTPRPVDGIYHACYVSARQALLEDVLLEHLTKAAEEPDRDILIEEFREVKRSSEEAYHDCMVVLEEHARLSDLGKRVLEDTRAYMSP